MQVQNKNIPSYASRRIFNIKPHWLKLSNSGQAKPSNNHLKLWKYAEEYYK